MHRTCRLPAIVLLLAGTIATAVLPASAAAGRTAVRDIRFAPGQSAVEVNGQVQGEQGADFRLQARAGQTLSVRMTGMSNPGLSFNVLPEGAIEAMAIGETNQLDVQVVLPADGAYLISASLPRSAARRHETGRFKLAVQVQGQPLPPLPQTQDARVAGTRYHATARISCRWAYAPAAGTCDVGVVRRGRDATATVDIRGSDGRRRRLLFVQGRLLASDSAWPLSSRRSGDRISVEIDGQERHEIPEALLTGG